MTPFGEKLRTLRAAIGVSAAYLSALEHGRRGAPTWTLIQKIIGYFNIIWDDAEDLARLAESSHPRVRIDTSGLSPAATELANLLAESIERLDEEQLRKITASVRAALRR
ncbi:MAG: transcriptional regulator [Mesorhizobium sp.]|nr:MAG: transcriptional regulator [Mesorhizobium sp.]